MSTSPNIDDAHARDLARAALWTELRWLRALLDVHTRRLQREGRLPGATEAHPGTAISAGEIGARRRAARTEMLFELPPLSPDEEDALGAANAERAAAHAARGAWTSPLHRLVSRFGLDGHEYLLLLLSLAPELDGSIARLCAFMNDHFERTSATLAMVAEALVPAGGGMVLRPLLEPYAPLRRHRLIRLGGSDATPLPLRPLHAEPRVMAFALGDDGLDTQLAGEATLDRPDAFSTPPLLSERDAARLAVARADTVLIVRGPPGAGRRRWAHTIAARDGLATLTVSLPAAARIHGDVASALAHLVREARLLGAMICLRDVESLADPGAAEIARALEQATHGLPVKVAVLAPPSFVLPLAHGEVIDVGLPDAATATRLWAEALPAGTLSPAELAELGAGSGLTPGQILQAAATAAKTGTPTRASVLDAVRLQRRQRMGDTARFVAPRHGFTDLVLPANVELLLRELVARHRHREQVLRGWGFGARFGYELGLSALFEGPPGTGKTMAASVIARELGLDLFRVDLATVVSKYVGETEKNLARVFDEAERSGAVLLFDEADSLFSKRTAVSSANDRYANLEVNFLLQRIESFSGIAILTTNFPESIDAAFARRLSLRVTFPKPGVDERTALWRSMLTSNGACDASVDPAALATTFDLSGGHIQNAVLRAAFFAASRRRPIAMDILRVAARIECKQQGTLVQGDPLADLAALA